MAPREGIEYGWSLSGGGKRCDEWMRKCGRGLCKAEEDPVDTARLKLRKVDATQWPCKGR